MAAPKRPGKVACAWASDIHFGAVPADRLQEELGAGLLAELSAKGGQLDCLVLGGDIFDRKISMNDPSGRAAIEFMNRVMWLACEHSFCVRVLKGTLTHDYSQLEVFRWMEGLEGYDFRIVSAAEAEEPVAGWRVLWLPEEYLEDPAAYYEPILAEGPYSNAFLHGTMDFVEFSQHIRPTQGGRVAPVFSSLDFEKAVDGAVICGHIHVRQSHRGKFYYPGSYTRWQFGEEGPKGWALLEHDLASRESKVLLRTNKLAPEYATLDYSSGEPPDAEAVAREVALLRKQGVRVRVVLPDGSGSAAALETLRSRFSGDRETKIAGGKPSASPASPGGKAALAFLEDKTIDLPTRISMYIAHAYGEQVPPEVVSAAISAAATSGNAPGCPAADGGEEADPGAAAPETARRK